MQRKAAPTSTLLLDQYPALAALMAGTTIVLRELVI
jgi:hypothetical protein